MSDQTMQRCLFAIPVVALLALALRHGIEFTGVGSLVRSVGAVVVASPVVLLVVRRAGAAGARLAGGRMVTVHGHGHGSGSGLRKLIATHEAGHAVAARAVGGRVVHAVADGNGGLVRAKLPDSPQAVATFLLAGQRAAGTSQGSSADNAAVRRVLREVPSADRTRVRREADRHARQIVSARRGEISRDAARLLERGRL